MENEFDGVFRFSNWTDEDITLLWNNVEYTFPKQSRSPMFIKGATPEETQEIRKRFAYKLAEREWYKGPEAKRLTKIGGGMPSYRDDKVLEPLIQKALDPLPISKAEVKDRPKEKLSLKATKPIDKNLSKKALEDQFDEDSAS